MNNFVILKFVSLAIIVSHSCDAYKLYDQDDADLNWLFSNEVFGNGFDRDFDDYLPNSYGRQAIDDYEPSSYYVDSGAQFDEEWNDEPPLYITYETLPLPKEPVEFVPPSAEAPTKPPSTSDGYYYPTPQNQYIPPNKGPVAFAQPKKPQAPHTVYLPPNKAPVPFVLPTKQDAPKSVYLPPNKAPVPFVFPTTPDAPRSSYLPPNKEPVSFVLPTKPDAPKSLYLPPTRKTTTTTRKPISKSTPNSDYLPPIVVSDPEVDSQKLPQLSSKLQPPAISSSKPIRFY